MHASLTIDVERRLKAAGFEGIQSDVGRILDILRPVCRATFFVTGEVAEECPDVVRAISEDGHEVGCHGLHHERFDVLSASEQLSRIALATEHLKKILATQPLGFRAPEYRANANTLLALEHLGYAYDSSVLSGTPFLRPQAYRKWRFLLAPREPYYPSRNQLTQRGDCGVLELPCSAFILPFVSKLSMRSMLVSDILTKILARRSGREGVPIVYCLHSYDSTLSNGDLSWLERVIRTLRRLNVGFTTMRELSQEYR